MYKLIRIVGQLLGLWLLVLIVMALTLGVIFLWKVIFQ